MCIQILDTHKEKYRLRKKIYCSSEEDSEEYTTVGKVMLVAIPHYVWSRPVLL